MKRSLISFLFLCLCQGLFAQTIIISGKNGNRPLTWNDFTGKPDMQSSFAANTWWNLRYSISGMNFKGDSVMMKGFAITLELNAEQSWVKSGMETDALLKHEQVHFDIGRLCAIALKKAFDTAVFSNINYRTKHADIFTAVMKEYHDMGQLYDRETDHGKKQPEQKQWEMLVAAKLPAN